MDMHKNCNYIFIFGLASANILVYGDFVMISMGKIGGR